MVLGAFRIDESRRPAAPRAFERALLRSGHPSREYPQHRQAKIAAGTGLRACQPGDSLTLRLSEKTIASYFLLRSDVLSATPVKAIGGGLISIWP